jgi:hypothetical protein
LRELCTYQVINHFDLIDLESKEVHDYQIVYEYYMQHWLLIWGIEVVHDSIWNAKELGAFLKSFKI